MPLYSYKCDSCGNYFEEFNSVADRDKPIDIPCECGSKFRRVVGCAGFMLKGFCWSKDNYSRTLGDDPRGVSATNGDMNAD